MVLHESPRHLDFARGSLEDDPVKGNPWQNWKEIQGRVLFSCDPNTEREYNFTGPLGSMEALWLDLILDLDDKAYEVLRVDRMVNVVPHPQNPYYKATIEERENLERKIKEGLVGIEQSSSDFELAKHDMRKIEEIETWLKSADDSNLKAMFVDQVDYHAGSTGQGAGRLSLLFMQQNNIMPTIVDDFKAMTSIKDLDANERFKPLPTVEKNFLRSKWNAYTLWKEQFAKTIEGRKKSLEILFKSRETTLNERRKWLKPAIARHKLLKDAMLGPEGRGWAIGHPVYSEQLVGSMERVVFWAWFRIHAEELQRIPEESLAMAEITTDDKWTRENLIYHEKEGLISHPEFKKWISTKWIEASIDKVRDGLKPKTNFREHTYWTVYPIIYERKNINYQGQPLEAGKFICKGFLVTKNMLMVKILEYLAVQQNLEHYIDEILGLDTKARKVRVKKSMGKYIVTKIEEYGGAKTEIKDKDRKEKPDEYIFKSIEEMYKGREKDGVIIKKAVYPNDLILEEKSESLVDKISHFFYNNLGISLAFFRTKGPYEFNIYERLANHYLAPLAHRFNGQIRGTLFSNAKVGE